MKIEGQLCNPRNRESAVDYVFNAIISAITYRELKPGGRLPTESELSQNLGVGRNSVREAIKKLEAYGIVKIQRAEGTFVCHEYNQRMLDPLLYGMLLQPDSWNSFVQLRSALEIGTIHLACDLASPKDIHQLEELAQHLGEQLRSDQPDTDIILEIDRQFHGKLAQITNNQMILDVAEYIAQITLLSRTATLHAVLQKKETEPFLQKHLALLQVLKDRDYGGIQKAVLAHYEDWKT